MLVRHVCTGWFSAAPFMGAFSKDAQGANVGKAAMAAAKGWAVATPLALIIRGVTKVRPSLFDW